MLDQCIAEMKTRHDRGTAPHENRQEACFASQLQKHDVRSRR